METVQVAIGASELGSATPVDRLRPSWYWYLVYTIPMMLLDQILTSTRIYRMLDSVTSRLSCRWRASVYICLTL